MADWTQSDDRHLFVHSVCVASKMRKRGIGSELFRILAFLFPRVPVELSVAVRGNVKEQRGAQLELNRRVVTLFDFYRRLGFSVIGSEDGKAILRCKHLKLEQPQSKHVPIGSNFNLLEDKNNLLMAILMQEPAFEMFSLEAFERLWPQDLSLLLRKVEKEVDVALMRWIKKNNAVQT